MLCGVCPVRLCTRTMHCLLLGAMKVLQCNSLSAWSLVNYTLALDNDWRERSSILIEAIETACILRVPVRTWSSAYRKTYSCIICVQKIRQGLLKHLLGAARYAFLINDLNWFDCHCNDCNEAISLAYYRWGESRIWLVCRFGHVLGYTAYNITYNSRDIHKNNIIITRQILRMNNC